MKPTNIITLSAGLFLAASLHSSAIVGLGIERDCADIVLSWPSQGYEHYLIQSRPTLDPATPWQNLTNNYPANSTSRTTYRIAEVVPPCSSGGANRALDETRPLGPVVTGPQVMPADGSRPPVPLNLYPPGIDLTGQMVLWPDGSSEAWTKALAEGYAASKQLERWAAREEPQGGEEEGGAVDAGFFRVFHIPDWAFNVTNYTYDGPTFFPVDFKDYQERVENIQVLLDGQPIADAEFTSLYYNGQTNWGMGIYFDFFPNGSHQIQLVTTLRLNDEIGDTTVLLTLSNLTKSITVDNLVTFTNWDGLIMSSNFTYQAQSKHPNTYWWIDIFDAWENYVNGGSGYTADGQIEWTWDLTDINGNPRSDLESDPFFYAYITLSTPANSSGPQAGPATRSSPAPQTEYPAVGYWLFAYSDRHYLDGGSYYYQGNQNYMNGINGLRGGPSLRGIPNSSFAIKFGTNYTQTQRNDSWSELKSLLFTGRYRNFYYHGHGGGDSIGTDWHNYDTNGFIISGSRGFGSKAFLSSQVVSNDIVFNRWSGAKPFRFVWLDGCSTATGGWPGAFGVDKAYHDIGYYTNRVTNPSHRRPNVFVGWNQIVGGNSWGTSLAAWNYRTEWMFNWSYNWTSVGVRQAFQIARENANWPPGGNEQLWGALRVYGYTNLLFNGYNQKNDWPWP